MSIASFNPFSLSKVAEYSQTAGKIQEVVDYAESRFRAILTDINNDPSKTDIDRTYWIQTLLHRELEFVLSLIGTASALGQTLVIPIIVRTLASTFPVVDETTPLFTTDPSVLAILDAGEHYTIENYELRWWSGRKPRDLNAVEILNKSTLKRCLDHYKDQLSDPKKIILPAGAGAGADHSNVSNSGSLSDGDARAGKKSIPNSRSASRYEMPESQSSGAGAGSVSPCRQCCKYQQLLSDVLQDIIKFQNFSSTMSTSSENLLNIGIRRTAIFHQLHQAAILKESAVGSLATNTTQANTSNQISEVLRNASSELDRLRNLPPSSHKWTWGETLTESEVLNLRRTGTRPGRAGHSGYDVSLPQGKHVGEYSANSSTILSSAGEYHNVPPEETFIPPTELGFPRYFSHPDHRRIYVPFEISNTNPSVQHMMPESRSAGADSLSAGAGSIADIWPATPFSGSISSAGHIADSWPSGADSDSNSSPQVPLHTSDRQDSPVSPSVGSIAENWPSSAHSDTDSNVEAEAIADLWSQAESVADIGGSEQSDGDVDDVLQLADVWEKASLGSFPEIEIPDYQRPANTSQEIFDPDPASVAAEWSTELEREREHSGDELASPSYGSLPGVEWKADEDFSGGQAYSGDPGIDPTLQPDVQGDWSYCPEDFSFLEDAMFDLDNVA